MHTNSKNCWKAASQKLTYRFTLGLFKLFVQSSSTRFQNSQFIRYNYNKNEFRFHFSSSDIGREFMEFMIDSDRTTGGRGKRKDQMQI